MASAKTLRCQESLETKAVRANRSEVHSSALVTHSSRRAGVSGDS